MKFYRVFISAAFLLFSSASYAQQQPVQSQAEEHEELKHFRGSVVLYHTYIGTKTIEGKDLLIVPSIGLDLEYWFSHTWGIGSHNDLELISFEVEEEEGTFFERETPVLLTLDALWKPWRGLVVLTGPGIELEKEENFFVVRTGLEYELELGSHWDVSPTIFYDSRIDAYDTFSIGIGIGKHF